jgi:hypothetical protein
MCEMAVGEALGLSGTGLEGVVAVAVAVGGAVL